MAVAEKNWPTTAARDYKGTSPGYLTRKDGKSRADQLAVAVDLEEKLSWPTPTVQEAGKIGNQANHGQLALSNHPAIRGEVSREKYEKGKHGQAAPVSSSLPGSRQGLSEQEWRTPGASDGEGGVMEMREGCAGKYKLRDHVVAVQKQWATPRSGKTTDENPETWALRQAKGDVATMPLTAQVKCWPTPASSGVTGGPTGLAGGSGNREKLAKMLPDAEARAMGCGKLNPRWVETLMGLPVGWVMPSCKSPMTIAPTNCDSSATESCPPPQSELFAH